MNIVPAPVSDFQFRLVEDGIPLAEANCIPVSGQPARQSTQEHVAPGALVPVTVRDGHGVYRGPCVWLRHAV